MDTNFIQWLVGQTGVTGLAAFALWMLKNVYDDKLKRERDLNDTLLSTIKDNTEALTALREAINNLARAK